MSNTAVILDIDQDYTMTDTQDVTKSDNNIKETNIDKSLKNKKSDNSERSIDIISEHNGLEFDDLKIDDLKIDEDILQMAKNMQIKKNEEKNQLQSKFFNKKIIEKIKLGLENEISDAATLRFTWSKVSTAMFCISEILMIVQTALSFTAASYQLILISYLAGIIGVVAIGFNRFGAYTKNQSTEKTNQLNDLLKTIGINNTLPDLMKYTQEKNTNKT